MPLSSTVEPTPRTLSNPGIGSAWDSVVTLAKPSQSFNASGVYLGGGYFLTANHVDAVEIGQQIKINGTLYSLDTTFDTDGIKPISGVDLKVFKVVAPPVLPSATLNTNGSLDVSRYSVLVGNGVGKGTEVINQGWNWGDSTTSAKRWATNYTLNATDSLTLSNIYGYSALGTLFYAGYGNDTGTVSLGDSGSALFQFIGGAWVLSGVPTSVQVSGSSFYNRGPTSPVPSPDYSVYVRISDYADDIQAAIPEPGTILLTILGVSLLPFLAKVTQVRG
ncbi:MAG: hypothetical protein LC104_15750 [Bacteroidales bacterium]|nr:hypothetical protein [Bacteroidales bacterium]